MREEGDFAWGQSLRDGYVGWVETSSPGRRHRIADPLGHGAPRDDPFAAEDPGAVAGDPGHERRFAASFKNKAPTRKSLG